MSRVMPTGACWCPRCNQPGTALGEDDYQPAAATADPWAEVA